MTPNTNELVVSLDIGTTKIVAIAGRLNEHGKIEVLGVGKAESLGVMRGVVANIDKTVQAIVQAVEEAIINAMIAAETMEGINGNKAYALPHDLLIETLKKYNRIK